MIQLAPVVHRGAFVCPPLKPVFHLATLFAQREAKTRIRHRDWLNLAGEKIRCEQVGTVPTFLSVRANKIAKWKTGLRELGNRSEKQGTVEISERERAPFQNLNQSQNYLMTSTLANLRSLWLLYFLFFVRICMSFIKYYLLKKCCII